ncbi:hypothetical protein GPECTOR_39g389 [Gonium pectorale]|uniref:Uncharacterized protein n=1 Tax=Gonium pectorale TaxID=33097 RepID=A0A150GBE9_GONPE|nr:hypothetical protein GPECTOR_39g389 [Gonium pectorale]|eukprot:KXZ46895.1 hypothetical protein GPECTOR_39g389 [Gonium pectorale]
MCTFVGRGLRKQQRWIKPELWIPLAQWALASEVQPAGVNFKFDIKSGEVVGMSTPAYQAVKLEPLGPGDVAELSNMLSTVWESCYRLLVSCRQLDSQLSRTTTALTRTRQELQEVTEKHKGLIEELHIKFALVLDAKKDKLIEQRQRIKELEAQLKAAQEELAEAEAQHTDNEEEAEPELEAPETAMQTAGRQEGVPGRDGGGEASGGALAPAVGPSGFSVDAAAGGGAGGGGGTYASLGHTQLDEAMVVYEGGTDEEEDDDAVLGLGPAGGRRGR